MAELMRVLAQRNNPAVSHQGVPLSSPLADFLIGFAISLQAHGLCNDQMQCSE